MSRPSDSFELDELKEEYDWLYEFDSRMAERITHDPDVHNLVDYVNKLESENAKLRDEFRKMDQWHSAELMAALDDNNKLREACAELLEMAESHDPEWLHWPEMYEELRKLGVEV